MNVQNQVEENVEEPCDLCGTAFGKYGCGCQLGPEPVQDKVSSAPAVSVTEQMIAAAWLNRSEIEGETPEEARAEIVAMLTAALAVQPSLATPEQLALASREGRIYQRRVDEKILARRAAKPVTTESSTHPAGTPGARLAFMLGELSKRFPHAYDPLRSDPPEIRYLAAIDEVIASEAQHGGESIEADAYMYACDLMEQGWKERAKRGVEIGTQGSLCDGIAWIFARMKQLEDATQSAKPVAWYDPTNTDPGQSVTFRQNAHEKWPHLYPKQLFDGPFVLPPLEPEAALASLTRYSMYAEEGRVQADSNLNEGPWVRFSDVQAKWPRAGQARPPLAKPAHTEVSAPRFDSRHLYQIAYTVRDWYKTQWPSHGGIQDFPPPIAEFVAALETTSASEG